MFLRPVRMRPRAGWGEPGKARQNSKGLRVAERGGGICAGWRARNAITGRRLRENGFARRGRSDPGRCARDSRGERHALGGPAKKGSPSAPSAFSGKRNATATSRTAQGGLQVVAKTKAVHFRLMVVAP